MLCMLFKSEKQTEYLTKCLKNKLNILKNVTGVPVYTKDVSYVVLGLDNFEVYPIVTYLKC